MSDHAEELAVFNREYGIETRCGLKISVTGRQDQDGSRGVFILTPDDDQFSLSLEAVAQLQNVLAVIVDAANDLDIAEGKS